MQDASETILSLLELGPPPSEFYFLWNLQVNVGTLSIQEYHLQAHPQSVRKGATLKSRVLLSAIPSSKEDTIVHKWMLDLINIYKRTLPLLYWSITAIPSSMAVSSSLPLSKEDPYHQPAPPLSKEGSYLRPVLPFRGESISFTCSSFPQRVHIFIIPSYKEGL